MSVDLSKSNYTLVDVVGSRVKLTRRGGEYTGLCPFHDDHNPSFYVIPSKGFCHCFSCGWNGDAIDFLRDCDGLSYKEAQEMLFGTDWKAIPVKQELGTRAPSRLPWKSQRPPEGMQSPASFATKSLGTPVGVWCYRDKDGFPLGYCTRYEVGDAPNQRKVVLQWTYGHDANETLRWSCRHFSKPRPLYGLDRLEARKDAQVIVVEGEKAADAAATLFPAAVVVTWPGGSNAPSNVDWSPLYGRRVVVIPDADEPGREAARFICAKLATNDAKVSYVNPEAERPAGWDLADALEDGWLSSEALDWAKQNKCSYNPEAKNPIPAPSAQAPNPAKEDTHKGDQLEAPPLAASRPHLAAVDGENLPPFPPDDAAREDLPPEFSDVAISKSLVKQYGENWRFCAEWGKWFEWNGQAWRPDTKKHIFTLARKVCVQTVNVGQGALLTDAAKRSINSHKTHFAVVTVTGYDETIAIGTDLWDQDPWILSTPDGVINLKTGEKRKARREDYSTKLTLVGPKGKCPLWMDFLKRVTAGDEELEAYLQRLSGYALTGVVDEHIFAFFYGEGGNGKGTFLRTLRTIMQDYACAASIDTFTESKGERHETELAMLRGARLCVAQETDEGRRWAESRIKALTGGDPVRARFMRQDYFEYKPEFKLIFAGNKKPGLRSVDDAMRRRVHIVPWVVKIPPEEIDHQLEEKFIPEYPGILKWMVDGCLKWQKDGINPPQCVLDATQEYLETEDALLAWLEECCEISAMKNETTKLIYKSYCEYCNKSGERPWSQKRLVQNLQTRGIETTRVGGVRMLEGIHLSEGEYKRLSGGAEENWWDN